jgi:multiple sugar transport system substrate-binding protein
MRKIFCVLLTACLLSASLGAALAGDSPVELTYLTYNPNVIPIVEAFNASQSEIHVTVDMQSENNSVDFLTKLDLLQLSGETGDVILVPSYREYAPRAEQGFFAPLDDAFDSLSLSYDDLYAFPSEVGGKLYGVPFEPGIYLTFINEEMLNEAGLPLPGPGFTFDDYRTYAAALTKGEGANKVYGSYMHTWAEFRREGLFNAIEDNPYVNADGSSNLDNPLFGEWLEYMYELENVDGSQISFADAKATSMAYRDVFMNGKAAMIIIGTWVFTDLINTEQYPHEFRTVFAPFPVFDGGQPGVTQGSASYMTIGANSKNPEAALKFINYAANEGSIAAGLFPSAKDGDVLAVLEAKVGAYPELFDLESATASWQSSIPNIITREASLFVEIDAVYDAETSSYMLGGQDLETALKNFKEQGEAIINAK